MRNLNNNSCLGAVKPLLWLLGCCFLSCGSSKRLGNQSVEALQPILQVAISESDIRFFMKTIQELELVPVAVQQRISNAQNHDGSEFHVTFRFSTKRDFIKGRNEILCTGVARIIHNR